MIESDLYESQILLKHNYKLIMRKGSFSGDDDESFHLNGAQSAFEQSYENLRRKKKSIPEASLWETNNNK